MRYKGYSIVVQTIVPGLPLIDFFNTISVKEQKHSKKDKINKNTPLLAYENYFKGDTETHRDKYR